jgi:tetratricopeptide (TPR) repeat protein
VADVGLLAPGKEGSPEHAGLQGPAPEQNPSAAAASTLPHALTDKDVLVLADFTNNTGEPVFDNTLKEALAIDLGQSPFLNVLSDFRVNKILKLMGRSPGDRITPDVGREICMRVAGKALLEGSISTLGSHYAVQLKATACDTGDVLAASGAEAGSREETLSALHVAASTLREKLGESLASIQKFDKPLEAVTTSSLEALKAYTLGNQVRLRGRELDAVPFYERATELDPSFAVAYARLGSVYMSLSQPTQGRTNFQRAFELRSRTSEKEKSFIEHWYYLGRGQWQKVIQNAEVHKQTYPREAAAYSALALCSVLGHFERAAENFAEAIRLDPDMSHHHVGLGWNYIILDRLDDARDVARRGLERIGDAPGLHYVLSCVALAQGDRPTADRETALASASPVWRSNALYRDAQLAAVRGQLRRSQELCGEANDFYRRLGLKEAVAGSLSLQASIEATFGYLDLAQRNATAARALLADPSTTTLTAIAFVLAGEGHTALALATAVEKEFPEDSIYRLIGVSLVRALVAIHGNNPQQALAILEQAKGYDATQVLVRYTRGKAFLQAGREIEAESEFHAVLGPRMKNLVFYGQAPYSFLRSLALLELARTYTAKASKNRDTMVDFTRKARTAYQDFLTIWKDADPDIPILNQAKTEYAELQ